MVTKEQKIRLGVFLVVSILLLGAIISLFIVPKLKEDWDIYYIDFKEMSVNGVNNGADVKYQGVNIGWVSRIVVNPKDLRSVLIYIKIQKGFPVKKDMRAKLQYAGITGLRFVEISGGSNEANNLKPGGKILTQKGLGEKAEDIVLNVDSVVEAINNLLNPENRERISQMIQNLERSTSVVADVLDKKQAHLGNSIENIEKLTRQLNEVSANLNTFTQKLNDLSGQVEGDKIRKMIDNTDTLIANVSQRFSKEEVGKVLRNLDTLIETSTVSIRKIENRFHDLEGELSRTLRGLRESMENISRFTRELTEDPTILLRKRAGKRGKK